MLMLKDGAILPMKGNNELSELRAEGVTKPLLSYLMDFNGWISMVAATISLKV